MTVPPIYERDPNTQPIPRVVAGERKRAALVLAVLAVIAVALALIMVRLLGGSGGTYPVASVTPTGPAVTVTGTNSPAGHSPSNTSPPSTSSSSSSSTAPDTSTSSTPPHPFRGPVSCPTSSPCSLPADVGDLVGAVNSYRQQHALAPVHGRVTGVARVCALTQGSTCPDSYYWEPVGRSGTEMLQKILGRGGSGDLLNPALHRVEVGWAYVPSSKSFWCALIVD